MSVVSMDQPFLRARAVVTRFLEMDPDCTEDFRVSFSRIILLKEDGAANLTADEQFRLFKLFREGLTEQHYLRHKMEMCIFLEALDFPDSRINEVLEWARAQFNATDNQRYQAHILETLEWALLRLCLELQQP